MAEKGIEFKFSVVESIHPNTKSTFEVEWSDMLHAKFIALYGNHDGSNDVDKFLSIRFIGMDASFISCIRKMHEMSIKANHVESPPPLVRQKRTKLDQIWSIEEEIELKYVVEEAFTDRLECEMETRWDVIATVMGGGRSAADYENRFNKMDKGTVDNELSKELQDIYREVAWNRVKCALAEVEVQVARDKLEKANNMVKIRALARGVAEEKLRVDINDTLLKSKADTKMAKEKSESARQRVEE